MRADVFLFSKGLARSRSHAVSLIQSGVYWKDKRIDKPAFPIPDETDISQIRIENPMRYVSRGGYKLEEALSAFHVDVTGMTALDIGASTGGFTDCLLQHGARFVYALDVGHSQLDAALQEDLRVCSIEKTNARDMTPALFDKAIDIAVTDVSFISQTLLYPAVCSVLQENALFISLIKPQFEAGRNAIGKNGIVKNKEDHIAVIKKILRQASAAGLCPVSIIPSPIRGGDGNIEYLALFRHGSFSPVSEEAAEKAVDTAFRTVKNNSIS